MRINAYDVIQDDAEKVREQRTTKWVTALVAQEAKITMRSCDVERNKQQNGFSANRRQVS